MTTSREIAVLCPCNDLLRLGRLGENGAGGRVGARVLVHFAMGLWRCDPATHPLDDVAAEVMARRDV
jgi:hypothetical protein